MINSSEHSLLKWSNLFFLIPLILSVSYSIYWYAIILLVVFIVSFDFHFFNEAKEVYYLDVTFSSILMVSNFILLFKGNWLLPYSFISIIFALIALFFYFRRSKHDYFFNHSLWHVFSAGVCFTCLITFISYVY